MKKNLLFLSMLISIFTIGNAQINFPDTNFKNALLDEGVDTDGDGEISEEEAKSLKNLLLLNKGIADAEGIAYFTNLTSLNLHGNELTEIDLSNNTKLLNLTLKENNLTNLDLSNNTELRIAYLDNNDLTNVNVFNATKLFLLSLSRNNLTNIDVSNNINLKTLTLQYDNNLTDIDVSNNINLEVLGLSSPNLSEIDLSNNIKLNNLFIRNTSIASLDVRSCSLDRIDFSENPFLGTVLMTGQPLGSKITLNRCPELKFICVDQEHINDIFGLLVSANQTNCILSRDCDDSPNHIQGRVTYDIDGNGCDNGDVPFSGGLRVSAISLTGGQPVWVYPNEQGVYNLFLADDTYFIVPSIENLTYYTFSTPILPTPTIIPDGLATLTTDYCVQSLGSFNDLEVTIIPLENARPGFEANYQITYTNNGTTTQSGTITLDYQDAVLNYVSSAPAIDSNNNGQLTWSFSDLLPMETVEIPVSFLLNTPTDATNPLNSGDILNFTATVTGATDETPDNNVMVLAQTVVNSYDPNDKTCLEGTILDPDDVGKYLHYLIRFENEGTANAINIGVTDVIDTTKLDIESFVPLKSSHSYSTTITNGNEIEFTFNNINLPFDDANNDGYVLFKIQSKDNLVEGDEIVNSAAIYFDFNFPIITEDEIVTVKREVAEEPTFSDYFTLSPNPTTGILNLDVLDDSIAINHILIYDIGGNLVGFYFGTTRTMNVSFLFPNTYVMKITTDKGELATQFIKL